MGKSRTVPDFYFERVYEITPKFLLENGIRGLILDVDNTLALAEAPDPYHGVENWVLWMRQNGIRMVILSNNWASRVYGLAKKLDIPFVSAGLKPLRIRFPKAVKLLGLPKEQTAMVGDQILTDIWGGNAYGITTILVDPFSHEEENHFSMRVKRKIEASLKRQAKTAETSQKT